MLRGPGDMLGFSQSGLKRGFAVDPASHWSLLEAASKFGRSFIDMIETETAKSSPANNALVQLLAEGKVTSFYDRTSASSPQGFTLRVMMKLFGERKRDESNTIDAFNTLQDLDASTSELSQDAKAIHAKLIEFCDESIDLPSIDLSPSKTPIGLEGPAISKVPITETRLNLLEDDVMFVVLDVETTGLDDKSCHIIQLAAKVLGSEDENDLFSEYILPPIDRIPKKIEEITGITGKLHDTCLVWHR